MNELLKQLQGMALLAETATAGPWEVIPNSEHTDSVHSTEANHVENFGLGEFRSSNLCMNTGGFAHNSDAVLIAAARNLLTAENLTALCAALAHVAIPEFQVGDMVEIVASRERALPYGLGTRAQVKRYNYGLNEVVVKHHNSGYLTSYNAANVVVVKAKTTTIAPTASQWVSVAERLPEENGVYLVFGNCTGKDDFPPTEDMARFYVEAAIFSKYRQPTHWMPLPTPPALTEGAQPHE